MGREGAPVERGDGARIDSELVERVLVGDMAAFAELYRRHAGAVLGVARHNVSNGEVAADVVQEAFARALDRLPSLRDPSLFRPWLLSIARHAAIDERRVRTRGAASDIDAVEHPEATGPGPQELAELAELVRLVRTCIGGLSPRDAAAVVLVTDLGFTPAEVARSLGITYGAAKVVVHRARKRLKEAMSMELLVHRLRQPLCEDFKALYDADKRLQAARHLRSCPMCTDHVVEELEMYGRVPPPMRAVTSVDPAGASPALTATTILPGEDR